MATDCVKESKWVVEVFNLTYNLIYEGRGDTAFIPTQSVPPGGPRLRPMMMLFSWGLGPYNASSARSNPRISDLSTWFRYGDNGWLRIPDTFVTNTPESPEALPGDLGYRYRVRTNQVEDLTCPERICSNNATCKGFHRSFFEYVRGGPTATEDKVQACMSQRSLGCYRCGVLIMPLSSEVYHGSPEYSDVPCSSEAFSLTAGNWARHHTDQIFKPSSPEEETMIKSTGQVQLLPGPLHSQ